MKFFIFAFLIIFSFDIYAQTTTTPNAVKASSDTVSVKKNTPKSGTATSAPSKTTGNTASVQDTSKSKSSFVKVPVASKTSNPETALNSDSSATKSKAKTVVSNSTVKANSDSSSNKINQPKSASINSSVTSLVGLKVYDSNNEQFYLDSLSQGKPTVVIFVSIKCLVSGLYNERYNELYNDYIQKATFIFINPNEEESWTEIQKYFKDNSLIFDLVKDKGKATANALNVTKIPTAFIFKSDGSLVYRGKLDNNPRVQGSIYGSQLQVNLDKVINGEEITVKETVAIGCDLSKPEKPTPKPSSDSSEVQ